MAKRNDGPSSEDDDNVVSIGQGAAPRSDGEEPEFFPLGSLEGDGVTAQTLVKKGLPMEVTVAIGSAEVPVPGGGLLDPNKGGRVMVSYAYWKTIEVPTVEDGKIVGWKVRQMLRAAYVAQANDEARLVRDEFEALLALDPVRAGQVLDQLREAFAAAQQPA